MQHHGSPRGHVAELGFEPTPVLPARPHAASPGTPVSWLAVHLRGPGDSASGSHSVR